jgi:hypothetical protein
VDGAARHREPKAALDEQPASPAPSDLGDAVTAVLVSLSTICLVVLPKLCNTISDQRFSECGVLVHGLLLWLRVLTRVLVTRSLVKGPDRSTARASRP